MGRINRSDRKTSNLNVDTRKIIEDLNHRIAFSFKYVQTNKKFNLNDCSEAYFFRLIEVLMAVSTMKVERFQKRTLDTLSNHRIRWELPKYTEDSFALPNEQLANTPWQFGLDNSKFGRIHGFFIDNFYIRWFDPKHRLYKLDENRNEPGYDDDYINLIKRQVDRSDYEVLSKHLSNIQGEYRRRLSDKQEMNEELLEELIESQDQVSAIKGKLCPECKNKIFS